MMSFNVFLSDLTKCSKHNVKKYNATYYFWNVYFVCTIEKDREEIYSF